MRVGVVFVLVFLLLLSAALFATFAASREVWWLAIAITPLCVMGLLVVRLFDDDAKRDSRISRVMNGENAGTGAGDDGIARLLSTIDSLSENIEKAVSVARVQAESIAKIQNSESAQSSDAKQEYASSDDHNCRNDRTLH